MTLTDRISLLEICNREFPGGIAVEVGVAGGHFARQILATWKTIGRLYLVDPWKHFDESRFKNGYVDGYNLDQETQEARYKDIVEHFKGDSRVKIIRMESLAFASLASNLAKVYNLDLASDRSQGIDFIYIDANHCHAAVRDDLLAWWGALKPGGIVAGHDYYNAPPFFEAKKAVDEFAKSNNLTVHVTTKTLSRPSAVYGASWEGPSWAIRKP